MDIDENRTHGAESAINDTVEIPANMTDDADQAQHIPGAEAIPADMPNAPHGDIPLTYDLQTFNALAAANTAMESELAARDETLRNKDIIIGDLRDRIASQKADNITHEKAVNAYIAQNAKISDERTKAVQDLDFAREQNAVLQRRLDRSLGYLDRVLDDEDGIRAPDQRTIPAPKPPVGPDLGQIPDAVRRDVSGRIDMPYAFSSARLDPGIEFAPPRPRKF